MAPPGWLLGIAAWASAQTAAGAYFIHLGMQYGSQYVTNFGVALLLGALAYTVPPVFVQLMG